MLSVQNISKSYLQRGAVLEDLSIEVIEKQTVAIMGPSGSGKTTLLNIIGLLDRPDSGSILFRGRNIASFSDDEAASYRCRNIGFVFQEHLLMNHLTVYENILFPLIPAGYSESQRNERIEDIRDMMERTGIESLRDKYPFQISGGEAQRVALVRALANKPSLLLADEPTGSLDAKNASMLAGLLLDMNKVSGVAIIIATHSPDLAEKMNIQLRLSEGKLA